MMTGSGNFSATVPVLSNYSQRMEAIFCALPVERKVLLERALAPRAFTAAQHLSTSIGFIDRSIDLLLGMQTPDDDDDVPDHRT